MCSLFLSVFDVTVRWLGLVSVPVELMNDWTDEWGREHWWNDATGKTEVLGG